MNMNISCRIANANTQCGRITNPPERSMIETPDGKTVIDFSPGKGFGKWETIRNGRKPFFNSQYPGDKNLKPGTAKFKYKHTLF